MLQYVYYGGKRIGDELLSVTNTTGYRWITMLQANKRVHLCTDPSKSFELHTRLRDGSYKTIWLEPVNI